MFKEAYRPRREKHLTSVHLIIIFYLISVIVATGLLSLPGLHREGTDAAFIDILFTAVSAVSVTGLTSLSIAETFNPAGVVVLAAVVQIGGIGVMTLGTAIWLLIGKRIGMRERQLIMTDQNQSTLSGLVQLMRQILFLIFAIELVGAILLFILFLPHYSSWQSSLYHAFFASVTATTNAGFDITGSSLIPFRHDYLVQIVTMFLITAGAIGFPVLIEIKNFISERKYKEKYTFTLFTKITVLTFMGLVFAGAVGIFLLEMRLFFEGKSWHETFFYSLFQSVTTRSGGLSTMNIPDFSVQTWLFISIMMFIGASPSSVGGGIRTTTFAVVLLAIYSFAKGTDTIKIFKREIIPEDVKKSFIVVIVATMIVLTATFILMITDPMGVELLFFEVCSAFGTTGLSLGITADLSATGKVILMILMFIGRIGILSFLFIIRGRTVNERYRYPQEKLIIGQ
ncbi:TrkH family potassium uptake protein [Fictibacillus aquaticus]|uniref:Ktr system potassium uptake protein D n=1 Tax=Fictibacillus aquaticus TaxID=2021314 RepID=A0A235F6J1_9BACL|nr:TrkH family potassium uptake protein [Fictibacillus aquaticus]OYD56872.1 Ktr system potassium uptake protein D [Fictibacillus aquaticus]